MTPTPQPKALELADDLERHVYTESRWGKDKCYEAAAELRRQHAEIEALKQQSEIESRNCKEAWDALSDHADSLRAEVEEWRKLKDPAVLHANLVRGLPADLTPEQRAHLAAGQMADQEATILALRAEVEREREARKAAQIRQAELTDEVVRLEPMRQRAADIERLTAQVEALTKERNTWRLMAESRGQRLADRAWADAREAAAALASERQANAILTNEVESLERRLAEARNLLSQTPPIR